MTTQTFDYFSAQKEDVPCNLCGGKELLVLARRTKNGLLAETKMCRQCGLIFISPRMKREGYDAYYKFHYRLDRDRIKGSTNETDLESNFKAAFKFGQALARRFRKYWGEGLTVDVGSSTGGILAGLKKEIPAGKIFGIEHFVAGSDYANTHNVPTKLGLFEDFKDGLREPAANIICVQSL